MFENFAARRLKPELMDDLSLGEQELSQALRGLSRIHTLSRSTNALWPAVRRALADCRDEAVLMDVAAGNAELSLALAQRASADGLKMRLVALDINEKSLRLASAAACRRNLKLEAVRCDAAEQDLPRRADIVLCSLFLHHLEFDQAIELLKKMRKAAKRMLIVTDLERSATHCALAHAVSRLVTRSRIVHVDAAQSVKAAFSREELSDIAAQAGLGKAVLRRHWPFRLMLTWEPEV